MRGGLGIPILGEGPPNIPFLVKFFSHTREMLPRVSPKGGCGKMFFQEPPSLECVVNVGGVLSNLGDASPCNTGIFIRGFNLGND